MMRILGTLSLLGPVRRRVRLRPEASEKKEPNPEPDSHIIITVFLIETEPKKGGGEEGRMCVYIYMSCICTITSIVYLDGFLFDRRLAWIALFVLRWSRDGDVAWRFVD